MTNKKQEKAPNSLKTMSRNPAPRKGCGCSFLDRDEFEWKCGIVTQYGIKLCPSCKSKPQPQSKGCSEECECDCHAFIGGSGRACPECEGESKPQPQIKGCSRERCIPAKNGIKCKDCLYFSESKPQPTGCGIYDLCGTTDDKGELILCDSCQQKQESK